MASDHHAQISTALFHAGLHNDPTYYRQVKGSDGIVRNDPFDRFLGDDPRIGYAGHTVNEWVDEYNGFHFYILQKNDYQGKYGTFLSYDVAVRNTLPNAYKVGGELILEPVDPLAPAVVGNFTKQTYRLTNTGEATDIVRIELDGALAETIGNGATKDQNAVLLNNLYAVEAGESIEFDVYVRTVTGALADFDLTVIASSETNAAKTAKGKLDLTTEMKIDVNVTATVARGGVYNFDLLLNEGATGRNIVWTVSDPSFALVDDEGSIYILNKTGTVRLIATDPVTGLWHSITLRIAS
jgi:hypothetical protein